MKEAAMVISHFIVYGSYNQVQAGKRRERMIKDVAPLRKFYAGTTQWLDLEGSHSNAMRVVETESRSSRPVLVANGWIMRCSLMVG
jgi:hypothetical protein